MDLVFTTNGGRERHMFSEESAKNEARYVARRKGGRLLRYYVMIHESGRASLAVEYLDASGKFCAHSMAL